METVTWELVQALDERGHDVTVLTTAMDHETSTYTREGVEVHELAYVPWWAKNWPEYRWWRFFGQAAAETLQQLDASFDVIHCQSFYADEILEIDDRPPVVATIHGTVYHHDYLGGAREKMIEEKGRYHPRRLLQWLDVRRRTRKENRQLERLDRIVPVSPTVEDMLETVDDDDPRVEIVPNGIDPSLFPPIDADEARQVLELPLEETIVLYLGRMDRRARSGSRGR